MSHSDEPSWGGVRGSRHERGYGYRWTKLRLRILKRDDYLCQACLRDGVVTPLGIVPHDHAVDHVKPKAKGGSDHPSNLEALCATCHDVKSEREAKDGQGVRPRLEFDAKGFPIWD